MDDSINEGCKTMNIIHILVDLSKPEGIFFRDVADQLSRKSFIAHVDFTDLTKSQKNKKYATYAKLKKKGLVKRTSKDHYMINPAVVLPYTKPLEVEAAGIWNNI